MICLESDDESKSGNGCENWTDNEAICPDNGLLDSDWSSTFIESTKLSRLPLSWALSFLNFSGCCS